MKKPILAALTFLAVASSAGAGYESKSYEIIAHVHGTITSCAKILGNEKSATLKKIFGYKMICTRLRDDVASTQERMDIWYTSDVIEKPWEEGETLTSEFLRFEDEGVAIGVVLMNNSPIMITYPIGISKL